MSHIPQNGTEAQATEDRSTEGAAAFRLLNPRRNQMSGLQARSGRPTPPRPDFAPVFPRSLSSVTANTAPQPEGHAQSP